MYNVEDLRKKALEDGVDSVIAYLSSGKLSEDEKEALKKDKILSEDGFPCLSLIYSLVAIAQ